MTLESIAAGTPADGNGLVLWVPAIANPAAPTVAELTAGTVKPLTYALAPDGFDHQTSVAIITSGRYTLAQALESEGVITDTLEVKYVYNAAQTDTASTTLTTGTTGFVVKRLGVANGTAVQAGQKVTVLPVKCGVKRDVPPTANTELMKIQKLLITGTVNRDVAVAA